MTTETKISGVSETLIKDATDAASLVKTLVDMGYESAAAESLVRQKGYEGAKKLILSAIQEQVKKLDAEAAKAKAEGTEEAWYKRVMNPTTTGGKIAKWTALALAGAGLGYGCYKLVQHLSRPGKQECLPTPHSSDSLVNMVVGLGFLDEHRRPASYTDNMVIDRTGDNQEVVKAMFVRQMTFSTSPANVRSAAGATGSLA